MIKMERIKEEVKTIINSIFVAIVMMLSIVGIWTIFGYFALMNVGSFIGTSCIAICIFGTIGIICYLSDKFI